MINILIVDDDEVARDGLYSILRHEGFEVIGQAGNGRDAVSLAGNSFRMLY